MVATFQAFFRVCSYLILGIPRCMHPCAGTNSHQLTDGDASCAGSTRDSSPDALAAARVFFEAWRSREYAAMYGMLTEQSRATISEEDFTKTYQDVANQTAWKIHL